MRQSSSGGGRRTRGSFVKRGSELYPLPEGLTGMIPTDLDALADSKLLSREGRERLAAEVDIPPAAPGEDESIAAFVSRRLGREAYDALVEPLMTGIYGGDGEQLSLQATFPNLRALELEHGSVIRGLEAQSAASASRYPPFVALGSGMQALVAALLERLRQTQVVTGSAALAVRRARARLRDRASAESGWMQTASSWPCPHTPRQISSRPSIRVSRRHTRRSRTPRRRSSPLRTAQDDVSHPLDGYGYVVPRVEGSDVLACTWTSSKWEGRAPEGAVLVRVYAGRFGGRDVTEDSDEELVALARDEVRFLGIEAEPRLARVHRWPLGMPQYVLGHPERLERIDAALGDHPGLALAGAAYRGVGIPDCIHSGEEAARSLALSLAGVRG